MYTVREVATVLGVKPTRLRGYLRAGLVSPTRGENGELRFSFQDLALLRKAEGLVTPRIPPRRVHDALRRLRARLGADIPLSRYQLEAQGNAVVVTEGQNRWDAASGQVVFNFEPRREGGAGELHELRRPPPPLPPVSPDQVLSPDEYYDRGYALEEAGDIENAMEEYRRAIAKDPGHADAQVNLGRLLHEAGRPFDALVHYRAALAARPGDGTAAFNLGVAQEDLGRTDEAIIAYEQAIEREPENADAHYNLARLHEQTGRSDSAIRHLLIYRRLTRKRK